MLESSRPFSDDVSASYYLDSSTDACISGYRMVASAVHKHGCKVLGQISHGGRMAEAGLDGAELTASHGMLIAQFLNPQTNLRDDEFGGSSENRFRIVSEMITTTRKMVGNEFVIGIRISADELEPDGLDITVASMMGLAGSIHVMPPYDHRSCIYSAPCGADCRPRDRDAEQGSQWTK